MSAMKKMSSVALAVALFCQGFAVSLAWGDASTIPLGIKEHPESLAYSGKTGLLYFSGNDTGMVGTVDLAHKNKVDTFIPEGADKRGNALGVKVDDERNRLFVIGPTAVYVYDLLTGKNLAVLSANMQGAAPMLNDLVIDTNGDAYVTDSFRCKILKVDGKTLAMTEFRDVSAQASCAVDNKFPYRINGIVFSSDRQSLLTVKTDDGTLWRINLKDNGVNQVMLKTPVDRGDGLVWGAKQDLYVIQNFVNRISKIDLSQGRDDEARPVTLIASADAGISVPTSAVYFDKPIPSLFVLNSQFNVTELKPFVITVIPLAD